jgi:hypothetical protein
MSGIAYSLDISLNECQKLWKLNENEDEFILERLFLKVQSHNN